MARDPLYPAPILDGRKPQLESPWQTKIEGTFIKNKTGFSKKLRDSKNFTSEFLFVGPVNVYLLP